MEVNRKCPYCGTYITFDETDQIIECPSCGRWTAPDRNRRGMIRLFRMPMTECKRKLRRAQ